MANYEIIMPKMGESVQEATITRWFKKEGDKIEEDDVLLEIATDKVDTEIPSPVAGTLTRRLYKDNDVVPVGEVIAIVDTEGKSTAKSEAPKARETGETHEKVEVAAKTTGKTEDKSEPVQSPVKKDDTKQQKSERFYE